MSKRKASSKDMNVDQYEKGRSANKIQSDHTTTTTGTVNDETVLNCYYDNSYYNREVEKEMQIYNTLKIQSQDEWEEESKKYEETIQVSYNTKNGRTKTISLPRRNYFNAEGVVDDTTLFPYHTSFYPIIASYDVLNNTIPNYKEYTKSKLNMNSTTTNHVTDSSTMTWNLESRTNPTGGIQRVFPSSTSLYDRTSSLFDQNGWTTEGNTSITDTVGGIYLPCTLTALKWTFGTYIKGEDDEDWINTDILFTYYNREFLQQILRKHKIPLGDEDHNNQQQRTKLLLKFMKSLASGTRYDEHFERKLKKNHKRWFEKDYPYGPISYPQDDNVRTSLLLKLLRHSVSDLQGDYRLASCIISVLIRYNDIQRLYKDNSDDQCSSSPTILRQILIILDSEFYNHSCNSGNTHDYTGTFDIREQRRQRYRFYNSVCFHLVHTGITNYTKQHCICISSFIRTTFLREFPLLFSPPPSSSSSPSDDKSNKQIMAKRKQLLVRAIIARQAEEFDADEENDDENGNDIAGAIPLLLIETLIFSLGTRACVERCYQLDLLFESNINCYVPIKEMINQDEEKYIKLKQSYDSYYYIVRTLIHIGNSIVQIIPESEKFYEITSAVVLALCRCCCYMQHHEVLDENEIVPYETSFENYHPFGPYNDENMYLSTDFEYGGFDTKDDDSWIDRIAPLRYVNHFLKYKSNIQSMDAEDGTRHFVDTTMIDKMFHTVSSLAKLRQDVLDTVRGLFVRNLVDIRRSLVGYGDFMVLCQYEISPLDPILFWSEYIYPDEEGDDEHDDEEESIDPADRPAEWGVDEIGRELSYNDLRARNIVQLMLLVRAWQAPWTAETHGTFQPQFRNAVAAIAKSTHRLGFPHEVMTLICSYLRRDWWDVSSQQCFNYACVLEKSCKLISKKMLRDNQDENSTTKIPALQRCPRCHVTMYCCKNCRDRDAYLGHKGMCCYPPFKSTPPDHDEIQLYTRILGSTNETVVLPSSEPTPVDKLPSFLFSRTGNRLETYHGNKTPITTTSMNERVDGDDNMVSDADEESSWETVDSSNEEDAVAESSLSITQHIRKYFPF